MRFILWLTEPPLTEIIFNIAIGTVMGALFGKWLLSKGRERDLKRENEELWELVRREDTFESYIDAIKYSLNSFYEGEEI